MATFTSATNGNWNDGATWGKNSPGTKGTDWPGAPGDVANVGHTVTYNVSETNELGALTITNGGLLTFLTNANTKITLGHQDIAINNGGELRVGASGAVIDKSYTAELVWNTTADNAKGINIASGGKLNIYGDPAFYGSLDNSRLTTNWTSGQTFTIVGDFTTKWAAGQQLTVHKGTNYSYYNTDTQLFTIASLAANGANTDITINETAPSVTFYAGGRVTNVSRNVKLSKYNVNIAIGQYNTNRPRIYDVYAIGNNLCVISNALLTGFYGVSSSYNFQLLNSVARNGQYALYGGANHIFSGVGYSNFYIGANAQNCDISAVAHSNNITFLSITNCKISGSVYSNAYGIAGNGNTITGNVYANSQGLSSQDISENNIFDGMSFGYNEGGGYALNTYDFYMRGNHYLKNVKQPSSGFNFTNRGVDKFRGRIYSEHDNQVANAHKIFDEFGNVTKVTAGGGTPLPNQRSGGAQYLVEMFSLYATCNTTNPLLAFEHKIWATASVAKTYRYYLQTDYTGGLTAGKIKLTGSYLDSGSGGHLGTQTHAPAITARANIDDWSQYLEVAITPSQDGVVTLKIELMTYESGKRVWIDPKVVIT